MAELTFGNVDRTSLDRVRETVRNYYDRRFRMEQAQAEMAKQRYEQQGASTAEQEFSQSLTPKPVTETVPQYQHPKDFTGPGVPDVTGTKGTFGTTQQTSMQEPNPDEVYRAMNTALGRYSRYGEAGRQAAERTLGAGRLYQEFHPRTPAKSETKTVGDRLIHYTYDKNGGILNSVDIGAASHQETPQEKLAREKELVLFRGVYGGGEKNKLALQKRKDALVLQAKKVGEAKANYDNSIFANGKIYNATKNEWVDQEVGKQYHETNKAYINRLDALNGQIEILDEQLGGSWVKPDLSGLLTERPTVPQKNVGQPFTVTDPRGVTHIFPNQESADAFKKAAGIK